MDTHKRVRQKILLDSFLILSLKNDFIRRVDIPQGGDEHVRQFDAVLVEILVAVVATVMPFLPPDPYKSPRYHLSISRMHDF